MDSDFPQDDVPGMNEPWDAKGAPPPPPPPDHRGRPQPSPEDVRLWTLIAHGSAIPAAFMALAFVGPLVVWLIRRDVDEISGLHAKEALNFNLSVSLYAVVSFILVFGLVGIILLPLVGLFWIINVVRAMLAVSNGQSFAYPMTIRFLR